MNFPFVCFSFILVPSSLVYLNFRLVGNRCQHFPSNDENQKMKSFLFFKSILCLIVNRSVYFLSKTFSFFIRALEKKVKKKAKMKTRR